MTARKKFIREVGRVWHVRRTHEAWPLAGRCGANFNPKYFPHKEIETSDKIPPPEKRCRGGGCAGNFE